MKYLRLTIIIGLLVLLVLQFLSANLRILQSPGYDYSFFHRTGQRVLNHQNPYAIYDTQSLRYPPTALLIFSAFAVFPLIQSQFLFFFTSLVVFVMGLVILLKTILDLDHKIFRVLAKFEIFLISFILVLLFFPFRYLLSSLHIHALIFLLLSLVIYFLVNKKNFPAGLSLALAGSITITPLFMLVIFFIQKKFKVVFYTILNVLVIALVTVLILGWEIYIQFLPGTINTMDFGVVAYYNQSVTAVLSRIINSQDIVKIFVTGGMIINLGLLLFLHLQLRSKSKEADLLTWNIGILLLLLFAPFSWQYHYILTLIPFIFLIYFWKKYLLSRYYLFLLLTSYILIGLNIKNPDIKLPFGIEVFVLTHVFWGGWILLCLSYFTFKKLAARG